MSNLTIPLLETEIKPIVTEVKKPEEQKEKIPEVIDTPPDPMLTYILTTRRAYNSSGDINMRSWIIGQLNGMKAKHRLGPVGNIIATVGTKSTTLFSCHTDTVHSVSESNTKQKIFYDPSFNHMFLGDKENSTCLGADDGAGIWMLLKMIQAGVPGTYIFHVGEEKHGVGAYAMLQQERTFLEGFDRAIAFDRANDVDVIITQGGIACASKEFGNAVCKALNAENVAFQYAISHQGSFTDTKVYNTVIPECINISVGYYNQHTKEEYLDYGHLELLLAAAIKVKWDTLKVSRPLPLPEPKKNNKAPWDTGYRNFENYDGIEFDKDKVPKKPKQEPEPEITTEIEDEIFEMSMFDIEAMCDEDPDLAAKAIKFLLMTVDMERARAETLERLYP